MNRDDGIAALRFVIGASLETRSSIAYQLDIDESQVSRIAAGKFKRMSGHALRACKYAQYIMTKHTIENGTTDLAAHLNSLTTKLAEKNPGAAITLVRVLQNLVDSELS